MKKCIVTITGIRPDFIRMKEVFRKLDAHFHHVMIHTGQHYDDALSKIFFDQLDIRRPDHTLETGRKSGTHYEQLSYLSRAIFELFARKKIRPDLILFLGDSHSVLVSAPLFKEGYRIGHIEGGMRSYDRRMPEEVNRVVCDYVSDCIFVYTPLYRKVLLRENIRPKVIHIVGNTITEIVRQYMPCGPRTKECIIADIHRNENLRSPDHYRHILRFISKLGEESQRPVKLVRFNRAIRMIERHRLLQGLANIEPIGPLGFVEYLQTQYHALAVVSDSGTAQEEGPLLGVPVIVPRNCTERPESVTNGNSILVGETGPLDAMVDASVDFIEEYRVGKKRIRWLGDGKSSQRIVDILRRTL
ncbi:MAG: hypothetical protein A2Z34_00780 [Planctomycetes bacterium RBG_16_59_8]|nr:MAG: hypothetical protein A2Z34_00780 [Planctomycetes bacterium RBG_16_59_8]